MPKLAANTPYDPLSGITPAEGVPANDEIRTHADASDFGGQVGGAVEKLGNTAEDLSQKYAQMATEASANDKIVNQWAPTATALSQDYYSKQGKDAVAGFDPYIQGLQKNREQILQNASPMEAQILNQYITRHIAQEYDGAMRHQVQQMDVYENQMSDAFVNTQAANAVNAGSNPDVINTAMQSGAARIQVHGLDRGQSADAIQQQQNVFIGKTTQQVVSAAVMRGDLGFANSFYANNKEKIPGPQQIDIERNLHAENLKNTVAANVAAIKNGSNLPVSAFGGMGAVQVKSSVASAAQSAGVDPNASLMIAGIESSFGQNVGRRGDIGQTGKPAADIGEQAKNLVDAQKQAQDAADKVIGGKAAPWQMYTVYQQGVGGGVALLKPENADKKAVDVVSQFYNNPKDAKDAILNNGGNVTMTSAQFTDMLHKKCDSMYGQVACNTVDANGNKIDLGKAILEPHQTGGITQQPTTNPLDAYNNYDLSGALQRANSIQNDAERKGTIEGIKADYAQTKEIADQYKAQGTSNLRTVTSQPDFYSVNDPRITPDMRNFMNQDQSAYDSVYRQAERNRRVAEGGKTPLGDGFSYLQQEAYAGKLNVTDMFYHLDDDLTQAGFDKLKGIVKPQVGGDTSNNDAMASFLKYGHERIVHSSLFDNTPDAEKAYQSWYSSVSKTIEDKQKAGVPTSQLIDRQSKDYVGGNIRQFLIPVQKQLGDRAQRINAGIQNEKTVAPLRSAGESPEAYLARIQ